MGSAGAVARRELAAYFRAPAGWAVLALFLCLQGIVFWMFVQFLGRPDAPPGGVMEFFFGGTILYWIALATAGGGGGGAGGDLREDVFRAAVAAGLVLRELRAEAFSLEEIFAHITTAEPARG